MDVYSRPAWVEIDHQAIRQNYLNIRQYVNSGTRMMGVIKANAYGHGAVQVAKTLTALGIDRLAVAMPEEALELRENGIDIPIHVLGEILPEQYGLVADLSLIQTVGKTETLKGLSDYAEARKMILPVHLKCDTGMGRLGPLPEETVDFVRLAMQSKGLAIEGLMTHLARGDERGDYSEAQYEKFMDIIEQLARHQIRLPFYHLANSPGIFHDRKMHLDMVRPGIILYGMQPSLSFSPPFTLIPALTWKARIVNLKKVPPDHGISYSSIYHTKREELIAVVPMGYADGFRRSLSNQGEVLVQGRRVPVRGRICMDQFMISLDGLPEAKTGDEVVIIGRQDEEEITAHEFAIRAGTLNYDATCSISPRVPVRHINL